MNLGDWALVFPAIAFGSLLGIAYALGREHGEREERRKAAIRRAHKARLDGELR